MFHMLLGSNAAQAKNGQHGELKENILKYLFNNLKPQTVSTVLSQFPCQYSVERNETQRQQLTNQTGEKTLGRSARQPLLKPRQVNRRQHAKGDAAKTDGRQIGKTVSGGS